MTPKPVTFSPKILKKEREMRALQVEFEMLDETDDTRKLTEADLLAEMQEEFGHDHKKPLQISDILTNDHLQFPDEK